jgi:hypothetical protein
MSLVGGVVGWSIGENDMNKYLFFFASAAGLALVHAASAQYLPPTLGGTAIGQGYTAPGYTAPGYAAPSYTPPGYAAPASPSPSYTAPGYNWREQRANEDWRNNTWREQRANEDWRSNDWRQQRANEDWRQREEIAKQRNPNNAVDRGYVEPDPAAKAATEAKKKALEKEEECNIVTMKSSPMCQDRVKDKTKNTAVDTTKKSDTIRPGSK